MTPIQALEHIRVLCSPDRAIDRHEISDVAMQALVRATPIQPVAPAKPLTLAQQHADELVIALRRARNCLEPQDYGLTLGVVDELLAKIDPPPPTLGEALDLLRTVRNRFQVGDNVSDIDQLLARVPK